MANHQRILTGSEQQAVILLEVQQITGSILLFASALSQEAYFDSFEHDFPQIVDLASRLVHEKGGNIKEQRLLCPSFYMGIIPQLYFVASRCRHLLIRRKALHLLRNGPSQEDIWNSDMLSNIAEHLIKVEERGLLVVCSSADIPPTARISVLNARINSAKRTVALHYCRPVLEELESMQILHENVRY